MTRVLITGADGFVGSHVLKYLLKHTDWQFVCLCSWRHKGNPLRIQPQKLGGKHKRVEVITHDLTGTMPDLGDFDYILHLASESHVDRSIADPVNFIENNVSITLQMLEYARAHPPKVFIQFSTDEVFGTTNHAEQDVLMPSNPYAASKAAQEMIAISYMRTYGLPIVITNSNNIVGPGQDPEKFIPKVVNLVKAGEEVSIHTTDGTPGTRYYNPVDNISDALLFILRLENRTVNAMVKPLRFSIPGGKQLNNLEMAGLIAQILDKPLKYRLVDAETVRPGYDQFYPAAEGRLLEMGWKPPQTLEEGMQWIKDM